MNRLFTPFTAGDLELPNRMVMAPLTRGRTGPERIPNDLMVEYYRQRATAGLIISEATIISEQAAGWINTPGLYNEEQVQGWKRVTDAVHAAGGKIVVQLWHMGRSSHPDFQPGGVLPVAPSAIALRGDGIHTPSGKKPYPTPRALDADEIPGIVADYAQATRLAQKAGFDGVEIHGANGYLIDQFLRDGTNHRTDGYGGSVENRARFLLEVTEAVVGAWKPGRVGVRLSPTGAFGDMSDSNPAVCVNVCPAIVIADRGPFTVMLPAFEKPTLGARNWADPAELVFVVMVIVPSLLKPVAFIWKKAAVVPAVAVVEFKTVSVPADRLVNVAELPTTISLVFVPLVVPVGETKLRLIVPKLSRVVEPVRLAR
jgi:2,4-dienoyl-CoA reductase-like NADH-dependent reductase (Old Yellow Enzyme family)